MFQKRFIPNYLSLLRLLLVPVYLWIFHSGMTALAAVILIVCAATDALDGHLASKNNWITDLGKLLDPLADKLASLGALISLSIAELLPWWITSLAILKEVVMIVGASFLLGKRKIVVASVWYGKLATVLFYVVVLALHFFPTMPDGLKIVLWWVLFLSMAGAALLYLFHYLRNLPAQTK
ncbi:MAG: CDP-alcohol phosphatidyltransferase family protein [Clostridia bacterium]|nr:CDP-alcohol phosphatidyltransferase family protein [Clostridia bacterium]